MKTWLIETDDDKDMTDFCDKRFTQNPCDKCDIGKTCLLHNAKPAVEVDQREFLREHELNPKDVRLYSVEQEDK